MRLLVLLAILMAGCSTTTPAVSEPPETPVEPEPLARKDIDISLTSETAVCLPSGVDSCTGVFDREEDVILSDTGFARNATLTFTWDATSPTSEVFRAQVRAVDACQQSGCLGGRVLKQVEGVSPLLLDGLDYLAEGAILIVEAKPAPIRNGPVMAMAHVRESVSVEGHILLSPDPCSGECDLTEALPV